MPITVHITGADEKQIGAITLDCIAPAGISPDSVNGYRATIVDHPGDLGRDVYIEHRYGDHWTELIAKALSAYRLHHPR